MVNLGLQQNEAIVIQNTSVRIDDKGSSRSGELYLTNLNIYYVAKGMFGNIKGIQKYPLNQLKIVDGKAAAICGKSSADGDSRLQLFFVGGQQSFEFTNDGKKEIYRWIDQICQILKCSPQAAEASPPEGFSGKVKSAFGSLKGALGIGGHKKAEKVTVKCVGCMAPLSGDKGQIVRCRYCDTDNTL